MAAKIRRRLAVMIAGAFLAALALVNVAPVSADDGNFSTTSLAGGLSSGTLDLSSGDTNIAVSTSANDSSFSSVAAVSAPSSGTANMSAGTVDMSISG